MRWCPLTDTIVINNGNDGQASLAEVGSPPDSSPVGPPQAVPKGPELNHVMCISS